MSVNTSRIDEEQKEVLKKDTLIRLFKYLLVFKKQISVVLLIMAGTIAISMATPIMMEYAINVCVASGDVKGLLKLGWSCFSFSWRGPRFVCTSCRMCQTRSF